MSDVRQSEGEEIYAITAQVGKLITVIISLSYCLPITEKNKIKPSLTKPVFTLFVYKSIVTQRCDH